MRKGGLGTGSKCDDVHKLFILSSSLLPAWWLQLEDGDFRAYTCKKFLITVGQKMATAKRLCHFFFNLWELFISGLIWNFYKHFFCALAHPVHFRNSEICQEVLKKKVLIAVWYVLSASHSENRHMDTKVDT